MEKSTVDTLRTVGGLLIFVIVLVFVLIPLSMGIYHLFKPKVLQGTKDSFTKLNTGISNMIGSDVSKCEVPFLIQDDFAIVGFPKGTEGVTETNAIDEEVTKPPACKFGACVCLCNIGSVGDAGGNECFEDSECYTSIQNSAYQDLVFSRGPPDDGLLGFVFYGETVTAGDLKLQKMVIEKEGGSKIKLYVKEGDDELPNCIQLTPDQPDPNDPSTAT